MRLISLNTWGGRLEEPLSDFLLRKKSTTDIFCFQEVYHEPQDLVLEEGERPHFFSELCDTLSDHKGYFANQYRGTGVAVFVHKKMEVLEHDSMCVLEKEEMQTLFYPRPLQHVALPAVHIYNFHGVPRSGKRDTPERDIQTARVLARMSRDEGGKILVGDFNLMPDTQAIRSFEQEMRNLVVEGKFSTTRTHHYGNIASQPFADYAFVSPDIKVRRFEVLSDEVSDHRALELDVSG